MDLNIQESKFVRELVRIGMTGPFGFAFFEATAFSTGQDRLFRFRRYRMGSLVGRDLCGPIHLFQRIIMLMIIIPIEKNKIRRDARLSTYNK